MNQATRLFIGMTLVLGLSACSSSQDEATPEAAAKVNQAAPATPVAVERLQAQAIDNLTEFSGRVRARQEAEIRPQVSGIIKKRFFDGGETVKAGEPLFEIDAAEYQAAVDSAKASVASAQAAANEARDQAERLRKLVETGAVSAQQYDTAKSVYDQAKAQLQGRESSLSTAQISLNRAIVRSPIDGKVGRPTATIGALVTQNQATPLAIVSQLNPIHVDLTVAGVAVLNFQARVKSGELTVNKLGATPVQIVLENGENYPHKGLLNLVEPRVDETGGTVTIRAVIPNPDERILPGSFVRAVVQAGVINNAITIPQSALIRPPRGEATVMVVNAQNVIEQRPITIGNSFHNRWIVLSGLAANDRIVLSNFQRLKPGMAVTPQEQAAVVEASPKPSAESTPEPKKD